MDYPKPGTMGLAVIGGKIGKAIKWGQDFVERYDYTYTHAFMVIDSNKVIEAEPGGAEVNDLAKYLDRPDVLFNDAPVQLFLKERGGSGLGWEDYIRARIVREARRLQGIPYSYLDYLALAAERFDIKIPLVERRVKREDRMICSQLVDYVYFRAGIHLFDDGRLPQDVTPGDLERWVRDNDPGYRV